MRRRRSSGIFRGTLLRARAEECEAMIGAFETSSASLMVLTETCETSRIDHVERAPRGAAVSDIPGLYVKRKELRSLATLLHARNAGAIRRWRRAAQIVIIIRHRRGDVIVCIDDDCAPVNRERSLP